MISVKKNCVRIVLGAPLFLLFRSERFLDNLGDERISCKSDVCDLFRSYACDEVRCKTSLGRLWERMFGKSAFGD